MEFGEGNIVTLKDGKDRNRIPVMISSSENFTPLPKIFWFEALHFDVRSNQIAVIATDHQSEDEVERRLHNKYRGNFQYTQTKKS